MNNRKKLYLSLCRRKTNILIFLVLVSLSVLFLNVIVIYQAADNTIEEIKKTYGSSFKLQVVKDENNPEFYKEIDNKATGYTYRFYCGPNVSYEMLDRVQAEIEEITGYEAGNLWQGVLLWDYRVIEGFYHDFYLELLENPWPPGYATAEERENVEYWTEALTAGNSENLKEFQNGSFELVEGRHLNPNDEYKVLISKKLAEKNHLSVGDSFRIETNSIMTGAAYPVYSPGGVDTEIVGLFQLTYEQAVSEYTAENEILENWIVVDRKTSDALDKIYDDPDQLGSGRLYVENPDEVAKVMEEVRSLDWIDWRYFEVCEDNSQYSEAVKPLRNMKLILFWTSLISGILAMVLISLLMTHSAKKRRREWGILMAMGVPGKEIRGLLQKEYLIITSLAFVVALSLCMVLTPVLGNGFYKGMGGGNEVKTYTEEEIEAAMARQDPKAMDMSRDQRQLQDNILPDSIEVQFNFIAVLIIAGLEFLVVWFFVSDALNSTLKRKPMEILTMMR